MGYKFIDLSHTIEDGLITYKGLPAPIICDFMSREEWARTHHMDEPFHIGKIEMVANTGTYIDVPFIGMKKDMICQKQPWMPMPT